MQNYVVIMFQCSAVRGYPYFMSLFRHILILAVLTFHLWPADASNLGTNQVPADLTELSLESLMQIEVPKVFGASKFEQKASAAPSSVTIFTAEEIKRQGYRTLAATLQSAQGFNVSYDRNYSFLGARGVSLGDFNSRVLLLVDGHRVNNNLTDGAFIDTAFILDVDLVDRVEVIRGPSAVLYGNNAFFGVINVITRKGRQLNGVEVSAEYGEFDSYKGRVSYGRQFTNGIEMLVSGTYYHSGGEDHLFYPEFNTPAQNNGVARDLDGDEAASLFGSLSYADFTLEAAFVRREKENPTAQFGTAFNDPRLVTVDEQSYGALKYAHEFPKDWDVSAQIYYDRYNHEIGYPFGPGIFFLEEDAGQWWGAEAQVNKRVWDKHVLTAGAEFRDDFTQEQRLTGQPTVERSRESHGVFVQGNLQLRKDLHFEGGIRYDQYGDFDPAYDPRVALIYNPFESSTLKAIYGTAFRAPNFSELSDSRFQDIKPEEITSYELVYEQEIGTHLRSSVSFFYNEMENLIVFDSGNYTNFNAETKGMELALEGFWTNGIRCRASYSLQETTDHSVLWAMPDSPEHLVKLSVSVPLVPDKLFAGLEFQYTSDRHSLSTMSGAGGQPITVQGMDADGFGVFNFTLFSQNLVKNLELSASVYNIFDTEYDDPATRFHAQSLIRQNGRSFRLKATYRF